MTSVRSSEIWWKTPGHETHPNIVSVKVIAKNASEAFSAEAWASPN